MSGHDLTTLLDLSACSKAFSSIKAPLVALRINTSLFIISNCVLPRIKSSQLLWRIIISADFISNVNSTFPNSGGISSLDTNGSYISIPVITPWIPFNNSNNSV